MSDKPTTEKARKPAHKFGKDDILALCKLLDQAHSWIVSHQQQSQAPQAA
jgi:hypothetical protein